MAYSVQKLTSLMVTMLIVITFGSSTVGYYFLQDHYRTVEDHFEAEARNRLEQAANGISNQLTFYQSIVDSLASRQSTLDLLSFSEADDIEKWTKEIRKVLPGTLGSALTKSDGSIIGNPLTQRIGAACITDLKHFSHNQPVNYPAFHNNVKGLEHFDLMSKVDQSDSEDNSVLIISFLATELTDHLKRIAQTNDHLILKSANGRIITKTNASQTKGNQLSLKADIDNSQWHIYLETTKPEKLGYVKQLIIGNLLLVLFIGFVIAMSSQRFSRTLRNDLNIIHNKLDAVLENNFIAEDFQPKLKEIAIFTPAINRLAEKLQQRHLSLQEESMTDSLTKLHNRRYFDIVIQHIFEHSRRKPPAVLLLIDVNDFKVINDVLGHNSGDEVLIKIAQLLQKNTRSSDEVCRLGGDEFGLILQDMEINDIRPWVSKFTSTYDQVIKDNKTKQLTPRCCSLSIGICLIDADQYNSISDVVNAADMAMYRAKSKKLNSTTFAETNMPPEYFSH